MVDENVLESLRNEVYNRWMECSSVRYSVEDNGGIMYSKEELVDYVVWLEDKLCRVEDGISKLKEVGGGVGVVGMEKMIESVVMGDGMNDGELLDVCDLVGIIEYLNDERNIMRDIIKESC